MGLVSTPLPRLLELYAGIGGAATAARGLASVVAAVDIDRDALAMYQANFAHRVEVKNLEFVSAAELAGFDADVWWLSPPCQPYTVKGRRRDHEDRRSRSLLALIEHIAEIRPPRLALENVPGFAGSVTHGRLRAALDGAGYDVREFLLCPSELGWPNRRRRFYLVASRVGLPATVPPEPSPPRRTLNEFLDPAPAPELRLEPGLVERYRQALHRVEAEDPAAVTACFASGYGRQIVRSGSYLIEPDGSWRRFSPREVLRLLGFPKAYRLPIELGALRAYDLVGNSLSIPAVRRVLKRLGLGSFNAPAGR
jgi:DNA (cytosine-5)-methyltransferase 1